MRSERPIVLMYHRVDTLAADPWQLAVTPDRFATQIAMLCRRRRVVPLSWLAEELAAGRLPARTAAVTFDDGYSDVLRNALPILKDQQCPATVFVTTGAIGNRTVFWWDQLSRIVYETPSLPAALALPLDGTVNAFRLADGRRTWDRDTLHSQLHALLKPARAEARLEALDRLTEWAGADEGRESDLPMSADELRKLSSAELIEIGAHSVSHASLPLLSAEIVRREVVASRRDCEAMTGRTVTGFAYPFGDRDDATTAAVRAAGFSHAYTTAGRAVRSGEDPMAIPRIRAANWDETEFQQEILTHG